MDRDLPDNAVYSQDIVDYIREHRPSSRRVRFLDTLLRQKVARPKVELKDIGSGRLEGDDGKTWANKALCLSGYDYGKDKPMSLYLCRYSCQAALMQVMGTALQQDEACTQCKHGVGVFMQCVVVPRTWGVNGACANCHRRGEGKRCSLKKNLPNPVGGGPIVLRRKRPFESAGLSNPKPFASQMAGGNRVVEHWREHLLHQTPGDTQQQKTSPNQNRQVSSHQNQVSSSRAHQQLPIKTTSTANNAIPTPPRSNHKPPRANPVQNVLFRPTAPITLQQNQQHPKTSPKIMDLRVKLEQHTHEATRHKIMALQVHEIMQQRMREFLVLDRDRPEGAPDYDTLRGDWEALRRQGLVYEQLREVYQSEKELARKSREELEAEVKLELGVEVERRRGRDGDGREAGSAKEDDGEEGSEVDDDSE
ncbi:hypothetical protein QBC44DRAFT_405311 [Cladorrhinum sp. PSN332]|nr:hypothetical protein QBC44DRAFT_405311 [Cladorrhinum sp. PSN332]